MISRIATAVIVTFGLPVLAMIQPGYPPAGPSPEDATAASPVFEPRVEWSFVSAGTPDRYMVNASASPGAALFGTEIRRLSDEADAVDRLWEAYLSQCGGRALQAQADFGREWFSVLEGTPEPSSKAGDCADLMQLIRQSGDGIRKDLRRAVAVARRARLERATEVGLLRWHSLELP